MLAYARNLWLKVFRLDEERIEAILNDILEASLNSKARLKAIRSLYYLSFVPENREEIKLSNADEGYYSSKCLTFAIGTLRNLSVGTITTKVQMVEIGIGDTAISLCWLYEDEVREKALGTLFNLSAAPLTTKLLIRAGLIPLVLHITAAGSAPERALSTAVLFNLTVAGGTAAADALMGADAIAALRPLLLEPGLTCLAATLVAGHLSRHTERSRGHGRRRPSRAEVEALAEAEPSILAFSERLECISLVVSCLSAAVAGRPLFGLAWPVRSAVVTLAAAAAAFQPNRARIADADGALALIRAVAAGARDGGPEGDEESDRGGVGGSWGAETAREAAGLLGLLSRDDSDALSVAGDAGATLEVLERAAAVRGRLRSEASVRSVGDGRSFDGSAGGPSWTAPGDGWGGR